MKQSASPTQRTSPNHSIYAKPRAGVWRALIVGAIALLVLWLVPVISHGATLTRPYWTCSVLKLATGACVHTHVSVTGIVKYTRVEADGDLHIRLNDPSDPAVFVIAECVPWHMCATPGTGKTITVEGISRFDPEHHWFEVHPVRSWQ